MKYLLLITLTLSTAYSQSFTVENVQASQSTDGEHVLTVSYDLVSDDTYPSFMVHPEISIDAGESWDYLIMLPVENVLGDNIFAGNGKTFSIDLDDYYTGMYTNNALVRIEAVGREAVNLPSSFDNLFVTVEAGEYMGGQIPVHQNIGFSEDPIIKEINYTYEISKFHITNAQYAEFLIDVHQQNLITVRPWDSNSGQGAHVKGAFHGHGVIEPLYQEDCEYSYQSSWPDSESYCHNGIVWIGFPPNNNGNWEIDSHINFNGTTFIVEEGFGNHPVLGITVPGAMAFAHYYGLRLPNKEEFTKAANGMNFYDYSWGPTPNSNSDYSELGRYMNYSGPNNSCSFNNPWALVTNYNSGATTPVGYFNGSTYYYPDGFIENLNNYANCETIYEIETEDAVSPYGLYDCNGNAWDLTGTYISEGNAADRYAIMGGSGWNSVEYTQSTAALGHQGYGQYYQRDVSFRVVRTINTISE